MDLFITGFRTYSNGERWIASTYSTSCSQEWYGLVLILLRYIIIACTRIVLYVHGGVFLADAVFDAMVGADLSKKISRIITSYGTSGSSELLSNSLTLVRELCMSGI